jgi:hypothetical protein
VTAAERLQHREPDSEAVAHFINQLVFCFFAEDVRLLPEGFFTRILQQAARRPERCKEYLDRLFTAMEHEGGEFDLTEIRHFNGGLFDGRRALVLDQDEIALLAVAGSLDWGQIDPTIFGTLFERFLDPAKRSQIGAHYTDTEKIMMIVEPVILRPLRKEWDEARARIEVVLKPIADLGPGLTRTTARSLDRTIVKTKGEAEAIREAFLERLRSLSILDPACGSGNFLYLALQGVKDIEHKANLECEALGLVSRIPVVGPEILHGIEINRHAAELARTTIWIGHIQWAIRNGIYSWPSPVLRRLKTIECRDALIERDDATGKWCEANWLVAEFIIGNPPFLGSRKMLASLGEDVARGVRDVFADRVSASSDLVCWWFEKARAHVVAGHAGRVGLVATNSISGGRNRLVLDAIARDLRIFEAWADEPWIIEGAAVRVALVCFSAGAEEDRRLDGQPVLGICPDLTRRLSSGHCLCEARTLGEGTGLAYQGVITRGPFDIPGEVARSMLREPPNPNNRSNSEVLWPILNGDDIVDRPRDTWVIDFSPFSQPDAALFSAPFERIKDSALAARSTARDKEALATWWVIWRARRELRDKVARLARYIITPRIAKHRVFIWASPLTVPDDATVAIARDDDTTFGILHSHFHEVWSLGLGTWLGVGNDPRYTPTTTFETFPFPEGLTPSVPAKDYAGNPRATRIGEAARRLDELRKNWLNPSDLVEIVPEVVEGYPDRVMAKSKEAEAVLKDRTLTKLYNARPQWLADAHAALDAAVAAAYGWPEDISTDDALARLLELNLERATRDDLGKQR